MAKKKIQSSNAGLKNSPLPESPGLARLKARGAVVEPPAPVVNGAAAAAGLAHAIPSGITDEGIAERNKRPNRRDDAGRVKVTAEPLDKQIEGRARATMPWEGPDPLKEAAERYKTPGVRQRFLSKVRSIKASPQARGWDPVLDKNGDNVKVGDMFLGQMPEDVAKQRDEHYRELSRTAVKETIEQFQVKQEQFLRETRNSQGIAVLQDGETLSDHSSAAVAQVGLHATRGDRTL